jgi:hypothetical protein
MQTSQIIPDFVRDHYVGRARRALAFLSEHGWREVWCRARELGPLGCAEFLVRNLWYLSAVRVNRRFDRRHNVETSGDIPSEHLAVVENQSHGAAFISTPPHTFERAMDLLGENDLHGFTFIDIGSGKGRAMLLATRRPFRRVIGVEYARELVDVANRNITQYRDPAQRCRDLHCYCADATTFELPPLVLYFLRPFDDVMMARILARVRASYVIRPRKIIVLFVTPTETEYAPPHHLFIEAGFHHRLTRKLPLDWAAIRRFRVAMYELSTVGDTESAM